MKKINLSLTPLFVIVVIILAASVIGFKPNGEQTITKELVNQRAIDNLKHTNPTVSEQVSINKSIYNFKNYELFTISEQIDARALNEFVYDAKFLTLNRQKLEQIYNDRKDNIDLVLPIGENSNITLNLVKGEIVSPDFRFTAMETGQDIPFQSLGIHYSGVIEGTESLVSISIFPDHILGIISDKDGNWNLGSIKDDNNNYTDNYIYYNDRDLKKHPQFKCYMDGRYGTANGKLNDFDIQIGTMKENYNGEVMSDNSVTPMKVYFVADYSFWQATGGNGQAIIDYIVGFFNSVRTLYQNENIPFQIAYIAGYTSPDPMMVTSDTYYALKIFAAQIQNQMQGGHIAHLLSLRQEYGGGIASIIGSLCKPYNAADSSGSYCLSGIETQYNQYPNFSFTVEVVTHEMGHNIGSRHTHACVWPQPGGGIGPLDTCVLTGENSTFSGFPEACVPVQPQNGCFQAAPGTVMSYCHFCQTNNFLLGFGPYPGDTIRLRYSQAQGCLSIGVQNISEEIPQSFSLNQNYPNPFNPTTNIQFDITNAGMVKLYVYDMTGKVVAVLVNEELSAGTYKYSFDAGGLPSGIYFYKLVSGDLSQVRKMVLLK